ncbi:MAG: UDP-N-acetylglucosamine 1-carboxyvinyltransferase [Candidatus Eisenbacteria bacterium]|uniref:UDP-N-acetylglucosamine 1-carboxyvinyltransferase n=1 Tax=Eiseniibacteriota bacterium TaxID=2212470 RepID=A0A7Y2H1E9_UNCEI|nr:UDP-N-acetylglucosamine 1-carboxyvinyltransferase [Candidatus Eisenbacteria bacterium]
MDKFVVEGGARLEGRVSVGGSKNAALPIMVASMLSDGQSTLRNVPALKDIKTLSKLMEILGSQITYSDGVMTLTTPEFKDFEAPYDLVKTMRASVYVLGPLLARHKKAKVSLPGGCAWGPRPIDLHLKGFEALGAQVTLDAGYILAEADQLVGTDIHLDLPSVGATGNLMMAATGAKGTTRILNAAQEPEMPALADYLISMGASIEGGGTSEIVIEGGKPLHGAEHRVIPDRIEAGTFLVGAAMTQGDVTVTGCDPDHLRATIAKLQAVGAQVDVGEDWVRVRSTSKPKGLRLTTEYYPGFPTDLQAQFMAMATVSEGVSVITEEIYRDRFSHVPELNRLGADIKLTENIAVVEGQPHLSAAHVMATDLRASAALILAGLVAKGETHISRVYHIDRGYERIEKKIAELGGVVRREDEPLVT